MYEERKYWNQRLAKVGSVNTSPTNVDSVNPQEILLIERYVKKLNMVLDYGVGGGRLFPIYNTMDVFVTGWDIANFESLIKEQRKKYPDFHYTHYYSIMDYIWDMKFKEKFFDVIISFSVFTHIRPENVVRTLNELMRIGKTLIISGYDDVPLAIDENSYCFLHNYKKLFENYNIVEHFKINKISYFVIREK